MLRLFKQHSIRNQAELEGLWDFQPINRTDKLPDSYKYKLNVPGCWEMHPDFLTYRGMGSYRTFITIDNKCNLKLDFKGISHTGHIYFDGKLIGFHYNAYTPFYIIVKNVHPGIHELVVNVDNTFSEKSSLHKPNDYYTYGGITRTVSVEKVEDVFVERMSFVPSLQGDMWNADITVYLKNLAADEKNFSLKVNLAGKEINFGHFTINPEETSALNKNVVFKEITPWSETNPNLYTIVAQLSRGGEAVPCDDLTDRVGFRTVGLSDRKLYINNKEARLRGFNRHEDHPHYGAAIPFSMMLKDIYLLSHKTQE